MAEEVASADKGSDNNTNGQHLEAEVDHIPPSHKTHFGDGTMTHTTSDGNTALHMDIMTS